MEETIPSEELLFGGNGSLLFFLYCNAGGRWAN